MLYIALILLLLALALWAYAGAEAVAARVFEVMSAADDALFAEGEEADPDPPGLGYISLKGVPGPGGLSGRGLVGFTRWLEGHPGLRGAGWRLIYGLALLFFFTGWGVDWLMVRHPRQRRHRRLRRRLLVETVRGHYGEGGRD